MSDPAKADGDRVRSSVRVALLGSGVVGSQVVRLLTENAAELTARVGAPLELVGVAVRHPERHRRARPPSCVTDDAAALVARDRRRRRRRGDGRHRSGPRVCC